MSARKLPGSLQNNRRLDRWLTVNADGTVTVHTGKVEIGQGILTALTQIVAEELDVAIGRIRLVTADTAHSPDEGVTSGSRSIEEGGIALRHAAAEARDLFVQEAARRLGVSLEQLEVRDGTIHARGGGSLTYWELAGDVSFAREVTAEVPVKQLADHRVIGTPVPRPDIALKVTGTPSYLADMELPGMLHGRVARPPSYGAELVAFDDTEVRAMPGVVAVVRDGRFLGLVAQREDQAVRALRTLKRVAQWREHATLPADRPAGEHLLAMKSADEVISEKKAAPVAAATTLEAEYSRPFIAHASIGPSSAIAEYRDGRYRVWSHSQSIFLLRRDLALALRVDEGAVEVAHAEGAGCYGHNGADDAPLDAALLARAVPGRPVRVQFMRDDEFAWEPYGSAMYVKMRASLDESGTIVDWQSEHWSHPHSARPGGKGGQNLLAGWHLADPVPAAGAADPPLPTGGSHRNAIPLYEFPSQRVTNHVVRETPVRVSALRSLGAHANVFAIESFMDELAAVAGADPVEFRLRYLKDPRARAVVEKASAMAGWEAGAEGDGVTGRGIGFGRYKNLGCYLAVVAEVNLEEEVRVTRAWAAVDAGLIVNPDGARNQIEGGIVQATSWALKEQVSYDYERITTRTWDDYPVLKFSEAPEVEVAFIDRRDLPPVGTGEGAQGPMAAAIANAVAHAIGARVRHMPITRERIIAALA